MVYGLNPSDDGLRQSMADANPQILSDEQDGPAPATFLQKWAPDSNTLSNTYEAAVGSEAAHPADPGLSDLLVTPLARSIPAAIGSGAESAMNATNLTYGGAFSPAVEAITQPTDKMLGTNLTQDFEQWKQNNVGNIDKFNPDPQTTGIIQQTLFGLSKLGSEFGIGAVVGGSVGSAAGGVGAVPGAFIGGVGNVGTVSFEEEYQKLTKKEGVAPLPAAGVAALSSAANVAAFYMPGGKFLPADTFASALGRMGINGVYMNGANMASQASSAAILRASGNADVAAMYKWDDPTAFWSNTILAGLSGAHVPEEGKTLTTLQRSENLDNTPLPIKDAADYAMNVHNLESDTAPGVPKDIATKNAHVDTIQDGTASMMAGEDIDTSKVRVHNNFEPKPVNPDVAQAILDAQKENGVEPTEDTEGSDTPQEPLQHIPEEFREFATDYPPTPEGTAQAAKDFVIQKGKDTGLEHYIAIDRKTGLAIEHLSGEENEVNYSPRLMEALQNPENSIDLYHNHPDNETPLGPEDITSLAYPGVNEIFAHSTDGSTTSGKLRADSPKLTGKTVLEKQAILRRAYYDSRLDAADKLSKMDTSEVSDGSAYLNAINESLADKGLIEYKNTKESLSEKSNGTPSIETAEPARATGENGGVHPENGEEGADGRGGASTEGSEGGDEIARQEGRQVEKGSEIINAAEADHEPIADQFISDLADKAIADNPNLTFVDDEGKTVTPEAAAEAAQEAETQAKDWTDYIKAAVACYIRNGE